MPQPIREFRVDWLQVRVYRNKLELGEAAAADAAAIIRQAIARQGRARVIVGTGNSQDEMINALVARGGLDWSRVEVFHMDEYVGLSQEHPASFRRWLKRRVVDVARPGQAHYLEGDAPDPEAECRRYGALLQQAPIDITFIGFGENGHIAFNDPHVADFNDPKAVKQVEMDHRCRAQQVGEGHFPDVDAVPRHALTLTCPTLTGARNLVCVVPDLRKAEAVRNALLGPVTPACPAALVRRHPHATLYLDPDSASQV